MLQKIGRIHKSLKGQLDTKQLKRRAVVLEAVPVSVNRHRLQNHKTQLSEDVHEVVSRLGEVSREALPLMWVVHSQDAGVPESDLNVSVPPASQLQMDMASCGRTWPAVEGMASCGQT